MDFFDNLEYTTTTPCLVFNFDHYNQTPQLLASPRSVPEPPSTGLQELLVFCFLFHEQQPDSACCLWRPNADKLP